MSMAVVPCDGCTACCQNDLLVLHPERGDDPSQYQTMKAMNPITGKPIIALAHKPEGGCVYLTDNGCSIHGRAPAICREFDCRKMLRNIGAAKARKLVEQGLLTAEVVEAGRKKRHSLADEAA